MKLVVWCCSIRFGSRIVDQSGGSNSQAYISGTRSNTRSQNHPSFVQEKTFKEKKKLTKKKKSLPLLKKQNNPQIFNIIQRPLPPSSLHFPLHGLNSHAPFLTTPPTTICSNLPTRILIICKEQSIKRL